MSASILYYGHSTALLESEQGKRILIDPFLNGNPLCPDELKDPGEVDLICLTHGHSDHASDAALIARSCGAIVFANFELCSLLAKEGVSEKQLQPMNKGGRVEHDEININFTNAFHSSSYDSSDGNTYYAGEAAGIVIELESGRTLYHAGDTCLFSDMKLIAERHKPEVMFVPIGDRFTMGPEDAARAVRLVQPKAAIPIHFGTFPLLTGTPEQFSAALEDSDTLVVTLKPGESYEL